MITITETLGIKEKDWQILSLRAIKYFMKKMFYEKKKKKILIILINFANKD